MRRGITLSDLKQDFDRAIADSKNLPERPDNLTLLKLYGLFKQGTSGDASGDAPGMTDFIARAKWDAWKALAGTSQEEAMQQYIDTIGDLKDAT
jgi:acyl-CoA-binding protein